MLTSDWSDVVYLEISDMNPKKSSERMKIRPAKRDIQNPNGLGHGKDENDILIARAAAGILETAHLVEPFVDPAPQFTQSTQFNNTLDNPSYFRDPYAKERRFHGSGMCSKGDWTTKKEVSP